MRNFYQRRAFTLLELLVVIVVVVGLFSVLLPALQQARHKATRIDCVSDLKVIGLAFRIFATDHGDEFPMQVSTNEGGVKEWMAFGTNTFRVFRSLSNEVSVTGTLVCQSDVRKRAMSWETLQNHNISYFVGVDAVETNYMMILAGDRNLRAKVPKDSAGFLSLRTNDAVGWTRGMHRGAGDVVLADGSVQQLNDSRLQAQIRAAGLATNRFMLPD